jgi:thiamine biosynthesis lipoprotein
MVSLQERPVAVMGTDCLLVAVVPKSQMETGRTALRAAEAELRRVEVLMSTHLMNSEISRFNTAQKGQLVPLSEATLKVISAAQHFFHQTQGAFDATCRPLIELWMQAEKTGRAPTALELEMARSASGWSQIKLTDQGASKELDTVRLDLGGIAKGYAIDQALELLRDAGCLGGLVEVGGDLRCFGHQPDGESWPIQIRDPYSSGPGRTILLSDRAICTSGNYARYYEIGGERYSHIVDPRSGRPADTVPSVTVIASAAITADAWATALSVLGPDGLTSISGFREIEAMLVPGQDEPLMTEGFPSYLEGSTEK